MVSAQKYEMGVGENGSGIGGKGAGWVRMLGALAWRELGFDGADVCNPRIALGNLPAHAYFIQASFVSVPKELTHGPHNMHINAPHSGNPEERSILLICERTSFFRTSERSIEHGRLVRNIEYVDVNCYHINPGITRSVRMHRPRGEPGALRDYGSPSETPSVLARSLVRRVQSEVFSWRVSRYWLVATPTQ
jgi:hypothetical protein